MSHKKVRITTGALVLEAMLDDSKTAEALFSALPLRGKANTWGNEIYFSVPLKLGIEDGREIVEIGDIAYWPEGPSLCLFFGPTPISRGKEIRAASQVTVVGRVSGNTEALKGISSGTDITITKID